MEDRDKKQEEPKDRDVRRGEHPPGNPPYNHRIDHDDPVEEASDESFPASDPPAY